MTLRLDVVTPCLYCGHPAEAVDHIVPRSAGGTDAPSNLAPACKSCNSSKGNRPVEHFLRAHPLILARVLRHQAGEDVLSSLQPGLKPRTPDDRITTTMRIEDYKLQQLKRMAIEHRVSVNDILLAGIRHVLEIRGRLPPGA